MVEINSSILYYLKMTDTVEQNVQAARDNATVLGLSVHCVSLSRACNTVGKEQTVLPVQQVLNQG